MALTYYSIKDGLILLVRIQPGEVYKFLNRTGKWQDGRGRFEQYFYNGEIGAEKISEIEAAKLARSFGETLAGARAA